MALSYTVMRRSIIRKVALISCLTGISDKVIKVSYLVEYVQNNPFARYTEVKITYWDWCWSVYHQKAQLFPAKINHCSNIMVYRCLQSFVKSIFIIINFFQHFEWYYTHFQETAFTIKFDFLPIFIRFHVVDNCNWHIIKRYYGIKKHLKF